MLCENNPLSPLPYSLFTFPFLSSSQVVIFRPAPQHTKLEESQVAYTGDASKPKLEDFIKRNL